MSLEPFFAGDRVDLDGLSAHLDALEHDARLDRVRALDRRSQAALFEAAKGYKTITLADFVPSSVGAMREVIHHGRNTLPAFKLFQKRFCKPDADVDALWGYNEQAMRFATGPGYFVAHDWDDEGKKGVVIDYHMVPPRHPEGWPDIRPNSARLSRFVYFETRDVMRAVSKHVSIGRASRNDKWMDAWFVLCREDRS
jgi:hypothetical protein